MDRSENESNAIRYLPRSVAALGHWSCPPFSFKVYGLSDLGMAMEASDLAQACSLAAARLADINVERPQDCPGFLIYHKGSAGITLQVYWWVEGCILCQDHVRLPYDGEDPIAALRPHVVGCVWELALVNHEKTAWQGTMMSGRPSVAAYLQSWLPDTTV